MIKILFATSELFPLIKTGGLADVSNSLPMALKKHSKMDVVIALPGYPQVVESIKSIETAGNPVTRHKLDQTGDHNTELWISTLPNSDIPLWVVVCPAFFDRPGGPYTDSDQNDWPDNAHRFAHFSRVLVKLITEFELTGWQPDIVHCNDWQTALIPGLLSLQPQAGKKIPASVFTIHNLAYQGNYSYDTFRQMQLPDSWWSMEKAEFYDQFSFLKAGIVFADFVTTVSPTYAREILTAEYGCGMDGVLSYYQHKLRGILNGVDYSIWDPEKDKHLKYPYDAHNLANKTKNKLLLQSAMGFKRRKSALLVGMICRFAYQKGIDLLLPVVQELIDENINWVFLGTGAPEYEQQLTQLAEKYPDKVATTLGYDEDLAHRIEAAADLFLMPSRFEPCGLNQLYSLKYGTLPLVRATGGLADTVIDANEDNLKQGIANGFVFADASPDSLSDRLKFALNTFSQKKVWSQLQTNAMNADFSWAKSAQAYEDIYQKII